MGGFLSQPLTSKILQRRGNKNIKIGASVMQGWRENMEDSHIVELSLPNHPNHSLFGVFDGHCGKRAAKFCSENITNYIDTISDFKTEDITKNIIKLDEDFMQQHFVEDGTTAVFSLVTPELTNENGDVVKYKVVVANIGDSRAIVGKDGKGVALTEDHKPSSPLEQKRIEKAGGFVSINRVRGNLALSRAIGDRSYKVPVEFPPEDRQVSCIPDYKEEVLSRGEFLLIACDGIYEGDIFTIESVHEWIEKKLGETDDLAEITAQLLDECLARGSRDNMSAVLIQFIDGSTYHKADQFLPGPYHDNPRNADHQEAYKLFAEGFGITVEESKRKYEERVSKNNSNSQTQNTNENDTVPNETLN